VSRRTAGHCRKKSRKTNGGLDGVDVEHTDNHYEGEEAQQPKINYAEDLRTSRILGTTYPY
jgi:hypothetical protein